MALPSWDFSMDPPSESVSAHSRERSKDYLSSDSESEYQRALPQHSDKRFVQIVRLYSKIFEIIYCSWTGRRCSAWCNRWKICWNGRSWTVGRSFRRKNRRRGAGWYSSDGANRRNLCCRGICRIILLYFKDWFFNSLKLINTNLTLKVLIQCI